MGKLEKTSDVLEFGTHIEIESLSYYLDRLYPHLGDMTEGFVKWKESEVRKMNDPEKRRDFLNVNVVEYWQLSKVFPRLFLNSFHVAAYSLFETETCKIATQVGRKQNQKFRVSEIRGGGYLESATYYIKKLTGVDSRNRKQFSCWPDLKNGQRLRNLIVHSNGGVIEEKDIQLAKRCGVYDYDASKGSGVEVTITEDYCRKFIDSLKAFFSVMYAQMKAGDFL